MQNQKSVRNEHKTKNTLTLPDTNTYVQNETTMVPYMKC